MAHLLIHDVRRIGLLIVVALLFAAPTPAAWQQVTGPLGPASSALSVGDGLIFLGTNDADAGDIYVSGDGGSTWANSRLPNGGILVMRHTEVADFAGGYLTGLYRTIDGGTTWLHLTQGLSPSASVSALVAVTAGHLIAGFDEFSASQLSQSSDGGDHWTTVTTSPQLTCNDLVSMGDVVLAGSEQGLHRSPDAGATWSPITAGLPSALRVDRFLVDGTTILAAVRSTSTFAGVYRSLDGGLTWTLRSTDLPAVSGLHATGFVTSGGIDYLALDGILGSAGLYASDDAGQSWQRITTTLPVPDQITAVALTGGNILVGTRGAIHRSSDGGATWQASWQGTSGILGSEAMLAPGDRVLAGVEIGGGSGRGVWYSDDRGTTWTLAGGLGTVNTSVAFLPHANAIFAGVYGQSRGVYRSDDDGASFVPSTNGIASTAIVLCMAAVNDVLFTGTWNDLYRSDDGGALWTPVPGIQTVSALTSRDGEIFAGQYGLGAAHSIDGGMSFTPISDGLSGLALYINDLVVFDGEVLAATQGDGVYRWTGTQWIRLGLPPSTFVNDLEVTGDALVAATSLGMQVSLDGTNWALFDDGYAGGEVYCLTADATTLYAGSRGHGFWSRPRSELPGGATAINEADSPRVSLLTASPNPFNPRVTLSLALARAGHARLTIHDVRGRRVRALLDGERPAGPLVLTWDGTDDAGHALASGVYVARLDTGGEQAAAKVVLVR